jgi:hypothetical protein
VATHRGGAFWLAGACALLAVAIRNAPTVATVRSPPAGRMRPERLPPAPVEQQQE